MEKCYEQLYTTCVIGNMNKKWTNSSIDEHLIGSKVTRITDVSTISAPSITKIEWCCKTCNTHWNTTVDSVIRGSSCPNCAGNTKFTVEKLQQILNKNNRKITVMKLHDGSQKRERKGVFVCDICSNEWQTTISNITSNKQGCPKCGKCGRYNKHTINLLKNIIGKLYIMECVGNNEHFVKIGITKRNVKTRYNNVDFAYSITNFIEYDMSMYDAWCIENTILTSLTIGRYIPLIKFGGRNECYHKSQKQQLLEKIQEMINDKTITN